MLQVWWEESALVKLSEAEQARSRISLHHLFDRSFPGPPQHDEADFNLACMQRSHVISRFV